MLHQCVEVAAQVVDRALVRGQLAAERVDGVFEHGDLALQGDQAIGHAAIMAVHRVLASLASANRLPVLACAGSIGLAPLRGMSLPVPKTYKLYVGGKFPRSESGRSYRPASNPDRNVARGSRKDLRDAVVAARAAASGWAASPAYLRGQILYRLAEMLESRRPAMRDELVLGGATKTSAGKELDTAIALVVWYAGLCDKVQALLGSRTPCRGRS